MQSSPDQPAKPLLDAVITGLQDVKAKAIHVLDLRQIDHAVTDFFVVAHGTSRTQVESLAQSVERTVREALSERPWGKQGLRNGEWAILDYSNVVVHVFHESVRPRYALEELWGDAELQIIEEVA